MRDRVDRAPAWATFLLVLVPLLALYLISNEHQHPNVDAIGSGLPAWSIAANGDLDLTRFGDLPIPALADVGGRVVSDRPPGMIAIAVPLTWLFGADSELTARLPSFAASSVTASVAAALAVAFLHLGFRRLTDPSVAVVAAWIGGVATSTWTISADQLWPHGPVQLWLALAVVAGAAGRRLAVGAAFGVAIVTRPVTAIAAAVWGIAESVQLRRWAPVLLVAAGSLVGAGLLTAYHDRVFGELTPVLQSYGSGFVDSAFERTPWGYLGNVLAMLFSPRHSVFVWSPFLILLVPGLRRAWRAAPSWVRSSATAGLVYIAIHLALNRQSGGLGSNYRYPLAMLTLAAPLLLLSWREWVAPGGETRRRIFVAAVVVSIAVQASDAWVTRQSLFLDG